MPRNVNAQNRFAQIPSAEIQRSSFDRSSGYKTTFDAGKLIPMFVEEIIPGDTINLKLSIFARLATQLKPIMDNLVIDTHWFFVPNRLVWDNWAKFNGEQTDPGDSTDFLIPTMSAEPSGGYPEQSLSDYFGIPTKIDSLEHSALPHRAYALIYNEWYRSEDLQDSIPIDKGDGPDAFDDYTIMRRGKRHDYFTSCLPFAQKGDAVVLGIGGSAPVVLDTQNVTTVAFAEPTWILGSEVRKLASVASDAKAWWESTVSTADTAAWSAPGLRTPMGGVTGTADLSAATAATINEIRAAFQLQRLLERDARGGTRYTEIIRSHFGVTSPDQRLQRPEYLGGGSTPINVNPVAITTNFVDNVGELGAFATASSTGRGFTASFTEHGFVIGIVSARADLNYQQGLSRMWSRSTRFDHFWPALAHLGEQAVLQKEIWADGTANDDIVFGYQERFAEMRYRPSIITGEFRSNAAQSLDIWHLAQDFASAPTLNNAFIEDDPPIDRIIATPTEPHFLFDAFFQFNHVRPMPTYSVPGLIDHF